MRMLVLECFVVTVIIIIKHLEHCISKINFSYFYFYCPSFSRFEIFFILLFEILILELVMTTTTENAIEALKVLYYDNNNDNKSKANKYLQEYQQTVCAYNYQIK